MSPSETVPRSRDIAELEASLLPLARLGRGVAVAFWGDPGIGKSWLLDQVCRRLPFRTIQASASTRLGDFIQQLPTASKAPSWSEALLARALRNEPVPVEDLARAIALHLSRTSPLIVRIEDLHEANLELQRFWSELGRAVLKSPGLALLASSRRLPPEPFRQYRLEELSEGETRTLLEQEVSAVVPEGAVNWIRGRTLGNPLFSLEYFRYLARGGHVWNDGQNWRWRPPENPGMPASIEALIYHQLNSSATGKEERRLLAAKCMQAHGVDSRQLAQVADLEPDELERIELQLQARGVLFRGNFVHPLYRELFRDGLGDGVRAQIARKFIEVLAPAAPEQAAMYVEDARLAAAEALPLLERAVACARGRGDSRAAGEFLAISCEYLEGRDRALQARQAAESLFEFDLGRATELANLSVTMHQDSPEAVFLLARLLVRQGRGKEAEDRLRALPAHSRQPEAWWRERITLFVQRHDYPAAVALWHEERELQDGAATSLLSDVAYALLRLGRMGDVLPLLERARASAAGAPLELAEIAIVESLYHFYSGDYARAEATASEAVSRLDRHRLSESGHGEARNARARLLNNRAVARYKLGRYREAIEDGEEGLALAAEIGDVRRYSELQANIGCSLIDLGEYARAEELLTESCRSMEQYDLSVTLAAAQGNLAYLYLEWAPPYGGALALKYARLALENARRLSASSYVIQELFFASWAEALHGSPERARELVDELHALSLKSGQLHFTAMAHWVGGLLLERLGHSREAMERLLEGTRQMSRLGLESSAERMALEIDRLERRADRAERRLASFSSRGAENAANVTRRYFPSLSLGYARAVAEAADPSLRLEVLGPLRILQEDGKQLAYRARRGKELLTYLLEARISGRAEVPQHELQVALYPDLDDDRASSALQQLVYRIRSALGTGVVLRANEGYLLGKVDSDAEEFLEGGPTRLWRGPYLGGIGKGWDQTVADALHQALRQRVAEWAGQDRREVATLARYLIEAEPYDRSALATVLRTLEASGSRRELERTYDEAIERWREVGEELPGSWQEFLAPDRSLAASG